MRTLLFSLINKINDLYACTWSTISFIIQFNMFDISTKQKKRNWRNRIKVWQSVTTEELISLFALQLMMRIILGKPPKFWTELIKLKVIKHQKIKISHDVREEETSILLTVEAFFSCKRLPVNNNGTLKVWGISNRWLRFTFQIPFAATTY